MQGQLICPLAIGRLAQSKARAVNQVETQQAAFSLVGYSVAAGSFNFIIFIVQLHILFNHSYEIYVLDFFCEHTQNTFTSKRSLELLPIVTKRLLHVVSLT